MSVRFVVHRVDDLPMRACVLATGVLEGRFREGMVLHDEETGQPVRVLGMEFPTPRAMENGEEILLLDRRDADGIDKGAVLADVTTA
jgi:hypothetical protein